MTRQEIKNDICEYILGNILFQEVPEIDCSKNLFTEYGMDSITIIEIILYVEERYKVKFDLFNVDFVELKSIDRISENIYEMISDNWSEV